MNLGKVIFFAYNDGSVEYRDRTTMVETLNDGDLNRVWHLSQIGFTYAEDDPCTYFYDIYLVVVLSVVDSFKACKLHCHLVTAPWPRFEMMARSDGNNLIIL